ncbi:hypothetical protein EV182_005638, partial [Spiromyces aspiralis]
AKDGFATDFHLVHLGQFALRGAGLVMVEATAVTPNGRISPQDLGIWSDDHIPPLKRIADFIHTQKAAAAIQIAHAGRKASTRQMWAISSPELTTVDASEGGWEDNVFGPSSVAYNSHHWTPKELSREQIHEYRDSFIKAARRADQAGFDVIEIHGAHGYLINEFLSPITNFRTDEYGGSLENRARFLLEIVRGVRAVLPKEKPLFVRLSCTEWVEPTEEVPTGGYTVQDIIKVVQLLIDEGVDLIDCSSGGNHPSQKIRPGPGYQVFLSEEIRRATEGKVLTGAVGIITNGQQANQVIAEGRADAVFVGRRFLMNPNFALDAARDLDVNVKWPDQYTFGRPRVYKL